MSGKISRLACSVLTLLCVSASADVVYNSIHHTFAVEDQLDTTGFLNFAQEATIQQTTPCETDSDCGDSGDVSCRIDTAENRNVCKCDNDSTFYDSQKQLCLDCDCGESESYTTCEFPIGKKKCLCKEGYISQGGIICKPVPACYCGSGSKGCEFQDGKKVCDCKSGYAQASNGRCATSCQKKSDCSQWDDVPCTFDTVVKKSFCKCDNDSKLYVPRRGRCMAPCASEEDCKAGSCNIQADELYFCRCYNNYRGDFCDTSPCGDQCGDFEETLERCKVNHDTGEASCRCDARKQGFNYDTKNCTECDCGFPFLCEYRSGQKICHCPTQYYEEEGQCKDCQCGDRDSFTTCEFPEGKKKCLCKEGYIIHDGICKYCDCGHGSKSCEIQDGKHVCDCKPGYSLTNFGSGDYCADCDCGYYGECTFKNKKYFDKTCKCKEGYVEYKGKCEACRCSGSTASVSPCSFDNQGDIICNCSEGYAQKGTDCKECDCGKNGKCSFPSWSTKDKECDCDKGYLLNNGTCEACDCGENGWCSFKEGKMDCTCQSKYAIFRNYCHECSCGNTHYNRCEFNSAGDKVCTCGEKYALFNGYCEDCGQCGYRGFINCTIDTGGNRKCNCKEDYADNNKGVCQECSCCSESTGCSFDGGVKHCECKSGYKDDRGCCMDINECDVSGICPSTTECNNLPGDYACECKEGYKEKLDSTSNKDDCQDIDECSEMNDACISSGATCANTPGSYRCDCVKGYKRAMSQTFKKVDPKYQKCVNDDTPYRTATIVFGVLFGLIAVGAVCFLIKRHGK